MQKEEYQKMFALEDSHFWFVGKRVFIDSILKLSQGEIKNILDAGCGTGGTTQYLQKYGQVIGCELNPLAIKFTRKRKLKIVAGDIQSLPFSQSQFDLVTCFDVLYHQNVGSLNKAIREMKRVLKPGGRLLITDSAFEFLRSSHDQTMQTKRRFTLSELKALVERNGFQVKKASYLYFSLFPFVIIRRFTTKFNNRPVSDVQAAPQWLNKLLIIILKVEATLLKKVSFPWGSSVLIFAQKT